MTQEERVQARKAHNDRIKAQYHASLSMRMMEVKVRYAVETPMVLNHGWSADCWFFPTPEDAKAYAEQEVKGTCRVVELTTVDAHTIDTKVVCTIERSTR